MRFRKFSFAILLLLVNSLFYGQNGFIRGTVFDNSTGESLIGVTVLIEGTPNGAISDFDGSFNLNIAPGIYKVKLSFISYETTIISDVEVKPGEVTLMDNVRLETAKIELAEVTISAKQIRNTEAAINTIKMKSANLVDGISAFTLKRIGDSDVASSMKRVAGVSVEGGKYVYVRGLGDRYTKTTLNGVDIPGLDPDRNALQMDIFPNNIIDNLIVYKSFSAELPADFTGGVINIETKEFPEVKKGSVTLGVGYNPDFHFNSDYLTYKGGKTDFLAFDDGTRSIPANQNVPLFSEAVVDPNGEKGLRYKEILSDFNPTMAAIKKNSLMDYGFGFNFGNQHPREKITIGYNVSFSYKNNTEFYKDAKYGRYGISSNPDIYEMEIRDNQVGDYGVNSVFISGLAGFAIKTKSSKFRIYMLHLRNGESKAGVFDFYSSDLGTIFNGFQHSLDYSERSLSNLLIDGKHVFNDSKWNIEWKFSPTISKMEDPDIRFTRYVDRGETYDIGTESGFPERIWRNLEETNLSGVLHLTREFNFNGEKAKLKFGGAYTYKERDFSILSYSINVRNYPLTGDPDELFKEENLWPRGGNTTQGTTYEPSFVPTNPNQYNANVNYAGAYLSTEMVVFKGFKAILGVRYENYLQHYTGQDQLGYNVLDNEKVLDNSNFFPSVNLIYSLSEKQNLRFSYSKTIARPSLKEISYAEIYDPISGRTFIGGLFRDEDANTGIVYWDGKLVSTNIQNFDLRWELYQTAGQMVSLSTFYKQFDNPIEIVQYATTQKTSLQPRNVGDGQIFGVELEFRQSLGLLIESLNNFSASTNFTYVKSKIKLSQTEYESRVLNARTGQEIDEYRDMAGQAPFIVNAGMSYNGGEKGFFKGLDAGFYYNVQGQTLQYVGISDRPDIYSKPFHSLNFNSSKSFGKDNKFQIGLKIENILNSKKESIFSSYEAAEQYFTSINPGRTFEVKLSYNFF